MVVGMNFENSLKPLRAAKLKELDTAILEVGIALCGGGQPYTLLRRHKNSAQGVLRRSYKTLLSSDRAGLLRMVDVYLGGVK